MNKCTERLYNGMIKENPTFVQMLGMCPTLAVTTSAINGIGMGLTTTVILVMSNMMISLLRKLIPDRVRIPAFIIVIASFVTIVQFLLEGFIPSLYDSLGIFIPLIVVNCIILGRAESYASKNPVLPSVFDGLGMGLGFTIGLTSIGAFRELLGAGTIFGFQIMPDAYQPITIFILAPGAFFVLAFLIAAQNKAAINKAAKEGVVYDVCKDEDCSHCANAMCGGRFFAFNSEVEGESVSEEKTDETSEKAPEETSSENQGTAEDGGGKVSEQESEDGRQKSETEAADEKDTNDAPQAHSEKEAVAEQSEDGVPKDSPSEADAPEADAPEDTVEAAVAEETPKDSSEDTEDIKESGEEAEA